MVSSESERARDAVGKGIVELGLTADELANLNDHVESLWGLLERVEGALRPVADKFQEAEHLPGMAKDCSSGAAEKLGLAATYFAATAGSKVPERAALSQNTRGVQEKVNSYTTRISDVEERVHAMGRQVAGIISELQSVIGTCINMSDVNGEVNETLGAVAQQSRIAADLHADL